MTRKHVILYQVEMKSDSKKSNFLRQLDIIKNLAEKDNISFFLYKEPVLENLYEVRFIVNEVKMLKARNRIRTIITKAQNIDKVTPDIRKWYMTQHTVDGRNF